MQSFSVIAFAVGLLNAQSLGSVAGAVTTDIASPDTRINLGQLQKTSVNIVGSDHPHGIIAESIPHIDHIEEGELGHNIEQAGPSVIKGCYKVIPVYKTYFKQVEDFKTVHHQIKVMVPDFKTVKTYRTVERVVRDVVPEFKQVETMRPAYKTITTQVPFTKTVAYKVKSFIKKTLPPTVIPDSHTEFVANEEYTPSIKAKGKLGSPKVQIEVGSVANYGQATEAKA